MTLIEQFAQWSSRLRFDTLPPTVVEAARLCLIDYIGVALRADDFGTESTRAGSAQIMAFLRAGDSGGDVMVLGREQRLAVGAAALMNAYQGQSTSLDDTALRSMSHPGCAVIPAVLACAQGSNAAGADTIAAVVAGYEAMIRVGRAIMPSHAKRGFHVTATTAPFGAAAAAARMMRLNAADTVAALSIAGDLGAGLQEALFRSYAAGKLAVARGVEAGVMAAHLAADGMRGAAALLEGPEGFLRAMADVAAPEHVCAGLGEAFEIEEIGFKLHSGCRHWHAAVDAIIDMRINQGVTADNVESVHVRTYGEALRMNIDFPPAGEQARLSTPFAIAQALLGRDLITGDLFCDTQLFRPDVQALMRRVTHEFDPSFERRYPLEWPVALEVRTHDGRTIAMERDKPVGERGTISAARIVDKFVFMATPWLGDDAARRFARQMLSLETVGSMIEPLRMLARGHATTRAQQEAA